MTAITTEHNMATAQGQIARAHERGLKVVMIKPTGETGWLIEVGEESTKYRVRVAGARGNDAVRMVAERDITFVLG